MAAAENLDFVGLCNVLRKPNASRAEDASFLIELYQRPKIESLSAARLLPERIPAVVAGMRRVVVLQPAFSGLIADRAIDRMM